MKNVVVFVIDSLSFETLANYPSDDLFLKKEIFKNCVSFNNVYTDGAFTEAAIKSLYCGESALENCSYLYGNKYRKNSIFKTYKDKGYFVHFGSCELYPFSNSILEDCNDYDYNCWPSINNTGFNCRLDFFDEKDVFINELITNAYIETLDFFNDLNSKINHTKTYKNRYKEDTKLYVNNLNEEYVKYTKNEYSFQKSTSLLFKNPYPVFKFSDSFIKKNTNKLSTVKEKADYLYRKNLSKVKKNNLFFLLDVFRNKKDTLKRVLKYLDYKGTFPRILHKDWYPYNSVLTFNRYNSKKMASARSIINQTLSKIENKKQFFTLIQPQDYHTPSSCWSYDIEDQDLFDFEIKTINETLQKLKKYPCDVYSLLSVKYLDNQIQYFINELKNKNLFDDTIFVITSDHGDWTKGLAKRLQNDDIFYMERHHIPLFIYNCGQNKIIDQFVNEKDIHSIIEFYSGITKTMTNFENDYSIESNIGFGCPSFRKKELYFWYHDKSLSVSFKIDSLRHVTEKDMISIFSLDKDKAQLKNLIHLKKYRKSQAVVEKFKLINDYIDNLKSKCNCNY